MYKLDIDKKTLSVITFLSFIIFLPIIFSNHYYVDDLGRSIIGYSNWSQNGRPVADLIFLAISFGPVLPDISPLPQIVAIIAMSFCAYLCTAAFIDGESRIAKVMAVMPLITSPFLLENMSYKYDSLPMTVSILCAALPFVLKINRWQAQFIACMISTMLVLCIYQASINIYIIFSIVLALYDFKEGRTRKGFTVIATSVSGLFISYLTYSKLISPSLLAGSYNIRHSELATSGLKETLDVISRNIEIFLKLISLSFTPAFLIFSIITFVIALIGIIKLTLVKCESRAYVKAIKNAIIVASPFAILLLIAGPMLLLKDPVVSPRVLMAFGATITFFTILALWTVEKNKYLKNIISIVFSLYYLYSLGFSFAYANALDNQEKYENSVITTMISDINGNDFEKHEKIAFKGKMPISPEGRLAQKKYPLIGSLIQPSINNQWWWGYSQMTHFDLNLKLAPYEFLIGLKSNICKSKLIQHSNSYFLFQDTENKTIIFDFDKTHCN